MNPKYRPVRKKGAYNGNKTKKWDGKKWVPVNVVHRGQKATLNGKPVRADGKGMSKPEDGQSDFFSYDKNLYETPPIATLGLDAIYLINNE